jgi:hypothetical protein
MYIDCDSHYFPVKFLEGVSAKYPHSPRVIRNGDDVRSVLPDGTLIKNQAPNIVADDCAATEWVSEASRPARLAIFPQVVTVSACTTHPSSLFAMEKGQA